MKVTIYKGSADPEKRFRERGTEYTGSKGGTGMSSREDGSDARISFDLSLKRVKPSPDAPRIYVSMTLEEAVDLCESLGSYITSVKARQKGG